MQHQLLFVFLIVLLPFSIFAQTKKALDHADVHRWRKIEQQRLSNDGKWAIWSQVPVTEGDAALHLWNSADGATIVFPRAVEAKFSEDNKWLVFRIKPSLDSLKAMRRKKVKDDDLPKDTLGVYDLAQGRLEKIPRLKNFSVPEKWSGWIFYQIETEKPIPVPKDTATTAKQDTSKSVKPAKPNGAKTAKKPKKEDKDNGYRLIVRHTASGGQDTIAYVKDYVLAKRFGRVLLQATGKGDTLTFPANPRVLQNGVYQLDLQRNTISALWRGKGKFAQIALDEQGQQAVFLLDADTTKARIRPWVLCYSSLSKDSTKVIATAQSSFMPAGEKKQPGGWTISEHARPVFSEDGSKLYFGIAPQPVLNDTTLLPEEIVNVEVWSWTENRMYTQQKVMLESDKKRSYPVVWHTSKNKFVPLGSQELPDIRFQAQRDVDLALGVTEEPYLKASSWEGAAHKDVFAVDLNSGDKKLIAKDMRCNPRLSPAGKYIAWWSDTDTAWFAWGAQHGSIARLTNNRSVPFYDEETDVPDLPNEHGIAGWLNDDEAILIYDKYDIWSIDPNGNRKPERITNGREMQTTYRYLRLDPEERSIDREAKLLLHQFNDITKAEGYAWLDLRRGEMLPWMGGDFAFSRSPVKARDAQSLIFTKENYQTFPNLFFVQNIDPPKESKKQNTPADGSRQPIAISDANPQQAEYNWGSLETVQWTSLSGEKLSGLLVKPADFDPAKQYPMIVNFYEKLSDERNRHRSPDFHRSQINYTVYASRGYLVFAPDIPYRIGYPGESAYDAIVSGVTSLLDKGFVDPKRVALQGHSWGGYQAAYLVTRTNIFTCAEAGAPVANMTSAYGGIRWETGLSRAFQYEHQQSRIGGSLWEYPMRYLENSPLFALDKVQTPLLILHNDKDGAVPWYQGIELYSGLRRLGKPSWLLNYNDEPHWPVKLQNRIDFQRRMQQFFDHYLMGAPEPGWMTRGVPPMEKGILQGWD
jgi:dipeptidyl aminopeptidase/acylaminoacyl peptidase